MVTLLIILKKLGVTLLVSLKILGATLLVGKKKKVEVTMLVGL